MSIRFCIFKKYFPLFFLGLVVLVMSSCSNKKSLLFKTNEGISVKSSITEITESVNKISSPVIKAGDELTITNLDNETLINGLGASTPLEIKYRVDENGKIALPVIGLINIAGLTIDEAIQFLTQEYKKTSLSNPLFVIKVNNANVTLFGEFFRQGNFKLDKPNTYLINIIGDAGGFTNRADKTKLKIIRGDKKNPEIIDVDLTNITSLGNPKLMLQNGDIIYSQPRKIYVFTDNSAPILSYVGIGTTILSLFFLFRTM